MIASRHLSNYQEWGKLHSKMYRNRHKCTCIYIVTIPTISSPSQACLVLDLLLLCFVSITTITPAIVKLSLSQDYPARKIYGSMCYRPYVIKRNTYGINLPLSYRHIRNVWTGDRWWIVPLDF